MRERKADIGLATPNNPKKAFVLETSRLWDTMSSCVIRESMKGAELQGLKRTHSFM